MRRVQDVAMELFETRGFEAVRVEEIARVADVGAASIFRNFGTKERLVLWDEYDPLLFEAFGAELERGLPPQRAVVAALSASLSDVYERDRRRILRRANLIASTPALLAASRGELHALRAGFEQVLRRNGTPRLRALVLAATFASTLEIAVEEWRRLKGKRGLEPVLRAAFDELGLRAMRSGAG